MKSIVLPAGTEPVQFGELAHLIADAFYPSTGDDDERMDYGICYLRIEGELSNAVKSGALPVKDAMTLGPHPYPVGNALQTALVTVDDLREFLAGRLDVVTTEPTAAPVVAVGASDGVEPDKAGPLDKRWVMKRAALIKKHIAQWPTINRDFQDASENDLSKAAKAPGHGEWFEAAALNWAEQRGKLEKEKEQSPANIATVWTGTKHTIKG